MDKRVRYIIDKGFYISWVGGKKPGVGVQNTIDRGFDIPWVGAQNNMGRRDKYHG